jgi:hypothetical protein
VKTYSYDYSEKFHSMLDGQVERRLQDAILAVGSIWYTAWVNAGMPVLDESMPAGEKEIELNETGERQDSAKNFMKNRACE